MTCSRSLTGSGAARSAPLSTTWSATSMMATGVFRWAAREYLEEG